MVYREGTYVEEVTAGEICSLLENLLLIIHFLLFSFKIVQEDGGGEDNQEVDYLIVFILV